MLKTVLSSHFQRRWSSDQEEKQDTQCPRFHLRHVFIDAIPRGTGLLSSAFVLVLLRDSTS